MLNCLEVSLVSALSYILQKLSINNLTPVDNALDFTSILSAQIKPTKAIAQLPKKSLKGEYFSKVVICMSCVP